MPTLRHLYLSVVCILVALAGLGAGPAWAQDAPGIAPEGLSRGSDLKDGNGALIISVRSELYLLAQLHLYFLREGGDVANREDVVRFSRAQSQLAFGNSTAKHRSVAVQLPAGRYRLVGHGARCLTVPKPEERCLVDVKFAGIGETVSFPSRGYGEDAPVFEVREGAVTNAGDFALTARNTVEWSPIPAERLGKLQRNLKGLPQGPSPYVSDEFILKFPLRARSFSDDQGRRY